MAYRYENESEKTSTCPFRLVSLVRRQNGQSTSSFMAVAVDDNMETLKFFQENMQEVIQNLKLVKKLEIVDQKRLMTEELQRYATRGLPND